MTKMLVGSMGTVVREDGRVLMLQRQKEPYKSMWAMPGGKIEPGEHPDMAMIREFWEESRLRVSIDRFCGTVSEKFPGPDGPGHFLLYIFRLTVEGGELTESSEGPLRWFTPDELESIGIPSDVWMLRHMVLSEASPRLVSLDATETSVTIDRRYE